MQWSVMLLTVFRYALMQWWALLLFKVIELLSSLLITVYRSLFVICNWRNNEIFFCNTRIPVTNSYYLKRLNRKSFNPLVTFTEPRKVGLCDVLLTVESDLIVSCPPRNIWKYYNFISQPASLLATNMHWSSILFRSWRDLPPITALNHLKQLFNTFFFVKKIRIKRNFGGITNSAVMQGFGCCCCCCD